MRALASFAVCVAALVVLPGTAWADEPPPAPPVGDPPAGVALPEELQAPPSEAAPPAPGPTEIVVPPQPPRTRPIFPCPPPPCVPRAPSPPHPCVPRAPCPPPTVHAFDRSVQALARPAARCPVPCPPPCPSASGRLAGYGGVSVSAYPGLGFGVEAGVWFARCGWGDVAWEVNLNFHDLTDDFNNIQTGESGKWVGLRTGIKARLLPQCSHHPTIRAGFAWHVATGDVANSYDIGDIPDTPFAVNYYGGYLGLGWEFDLFGGAFTTGPEVWAYAAPLADRSEGDDGAYTLTFAWHFLLNF